jgi:hypothetical protein
MPIDEARWRGLVEELTDLSSIRRGANAQLNEMHDRAGRQRSALQRLEDQRRARTGEDLPADTTLADLAHPPPRDQRVPYRVAEVDRDRVIVEARVQLREVDANIARLDNRLGPIRERITALDQLRRRCLAWAAAQSPPVNLPDRSERVTATLPEATGPTMLDLPDAGAAAAGFAAAGPAGGLPANNNGLGRLGHFLGPLGGLP